MDLLSLLLLVSLALAPATLVEAIPSYSIDFDLATETYKDLHIKLNKLLLKTSNDPPYNPPKVYTKPILAKPRNDFNDPPDHWIMVHLKIGRAKTTLAIAHDDLYILGFQNSAGQWYIVEGFAGLPNNITLPFTQNYGDLIRGGHRMLYTVPLGNQSAVEAVRWIASYPATTTELQLTQGLARFVVMISEAMRFEAIREEFSGRWQQLSFITQAQARYVICWGRISELLMYWKLYYQWSGNVAVDVSSDCNVNNPQQALDIVDFLLRPRKVL